MSPVKWALSIPALGTTTPYTNTHQNLQSPGNNGFQAVSKAFTLANSH